MEIQNLVNFLIMCRTETGKRKTMALLALIREAELQLRMDLIEDTHKLNKLKNNNLK